MRVTYFLFLVTENGNLSNSINMAWDTACKLKKPPNPKTFKCPQFKKDPEEDHETVCSTHIDKLPFCPNPFQNTALKITPPHETEMYKIRLEFEFST